MSVATKDILDLLIAIEQEMSRLYFDYAMEFSRNPDQHSFWQNIAMEEIEHVSFLESESELIVSFSELQFVAFINKSKLDETLAMIKKRRTEIPESKLTHHRALEIALELELDFGEDLNRHAIKTNIPKLRGLIETMGSKNQGHIDLIKQQQLRKKRANISI